MSRYGRSATRKTLNTDAQAPPAGRLFRTTPRVSEARYAAPVLPSPR